MRHEFVYPAAITIDEEGFHLVSFRDFPEAHTDGRALDEALSEAEDCLAEAIAGRIGRGEPIPSPSKAKRGDRMVTLPSVMAAKAALHLALREAEITKSEFARRLGLDEKEVRRLLDPHYGSKMPALAAALKCLGKEIVVTVRDAA